PPPPGRHRYGLAAHESSPRLEYAWQDSGTLAQQTSSGQRTTAPPRACYTSRLRERHNGQAQKPGMTSPPARVQRAFHVSSFSLRVLIARELPSHMATLTLSSMLRSPDRPPAPPQSTSGFVSLATRVPVNVPWRNRPSIQLAQRLPAMLVSSF